MNFETNEAWLLRIAAKYSRLVDQGLVTPQEFVDKLVDEFAGDPAVRTEHAADVVKILPPVARDLFARRVVAALQPGYLRSAFVLGGRSPEDEHAAALIETARERAWAEAFRPLLVPAGTTAFYEAADVKPSD